MAHPTHAASLIVLLAATSLQAQSSGRPRVELGVAYTSSLVDDANGTSVSYALAPVLGAAYAWTLSPGLNGSIGARASRAGVSIDYADGGSESAGSGWVFDARVALEREIGACATNASGCAMVHAAAGATWASGPDDVVPFTVDRGTMLTGEIGAAVRVARSRPLFVTGAAQAFRLGASTVGDPIRETGTVMRFLLGVRHGR